MYCRSRRLLILLLISVSCNRGGSMKTVPVSKAYGDGFEVVVYDLRDGNATNVRSLPLKDAEQAVAGGARAVISVDVAEIQRQLSTGKTGDSRVVLTAQTLAEGKQRIRVAFHESIRTFVYEYEVDGATDRKSVV